MQRFHFKLDIPDTTPPGLEAYFSATPDLSSQATGTYALTRQAILDFLSRKGIRYGILEESIRRILNHGYAHRELIAQGLPPLVGGNVRFESLVQDKQQRYEAIFQRLPRPEDEQWLQRLMGMVVSPQQPIVKRLGSTRGAPGLNVFGQVVAGIRGQDVPFPPFRNAVISVDDSSLLLSSIEGIPSLQMPHFIEVIPLTVLHKDVKDSAYYRGTVAVTGNIGDYVRIRAERDILVLGTVDAAVLLSGRHIWIRQGVKGKGTAVIKAKEKILVRFAEQATVEAGSEIQAESLQHCFSVCLGQVHLGYLHGGELHSASSIYLGVAGSTGIDTSIHAGDKHYLMMHFREIQEQRDEIGERLNRMKETLSSKELFQNEQKAILRQHLRNQVPRLEYRLFLLDLQLRNYQSMTEGLGEAAIYIEKSLYPDTLMLLKNFEYTNYRLFSGAMRWIAGKYGIIQDRNYQGAEYEDRIGY